MKHYESQFICYEKDQPKLHITKDVNQTWPYTVHINSFPEYYISPKVTIWFCSRDQLTAFIDSVNASFADILLSESEEKNA